MPFDVHPSFAYASLNAGNMMVFVHSMLDIWYTKPERWPRTRWRSWARARCSLTKQQPLVRNSKLSSLVYLYRVVYTFFCVLWTGWVCLSISWVEPYACNSIKMEKKCLNGVIYALERLHPCACLCTSRAYVLVVFVVFFWFPVTRRVCLWNGTFDVGLIVFFQVLNA